jgi:sugar lactone lactonase YvrE
MDLVASAAQVRATGSLGAMPLIVLAAGATVSGSGDLVAKVNQASLDLQTELAALSSNSTYIVVPNVGHCIQCDAPDVVADAILNVLDATGQATSSLSKLDLVWSLTGEPNLLDAPQGVTVDTQGNVYVIDSGNRRIQKFDSSGKSLVLWGVIGTGPGQFRFTQFKFGVEVGLAAAAPLAVDGQSNIYVADPLNHRIQKFDANGQFLTQWGAQGDGDGQFQSPYGVAVDAKGNIFVSDFTRNDIQKFDGQGQFVLKWGGKGSEGGKFKHPGSIALDTQGNVYVVDYGNSRIQKFDGEGKLLVAWGTQGSGSGQFSQPVAVTVDKAGSVYVLDSGNWRIQKFDTNGFFLASWVRFGKERFHAPLGMTVDDDDYIYVSDIHDNRVVKLKQP